MCTHPKRHPDKILSVASTLLFCFLLFFLAVWGWRFCINGSCSDHRFFFSFRRGLTPPWGHKIRLFASRSSHWSSCRSSWMPSFLGHSGSLRPRSFICLLPRSFSFRPCSLMPLLPSGPFQRLILDVRPS
jgi:hypothetical protein